MPKLAERIQAFCRANKLTQEQMADAFGMPVASMRNWLHCGTTPPHCAVVLMDIIEQNSRIRTRLSLKPGGKRSRGRPFEGPNEFSFGSPTRQAALKEARKRKRQKAKEQD